MLNLGGASLSILYTKFDWQKNDSRPTAVLSVLAV